MSFNNGYGYAMKVMGLEFFIKLIFNHFWCSYDCFFETFLEVLLEVLFQALCELLLKALHRVLLWFINQLVLKVL